MEAPLGDLASVNEHVIRQAYWTAFLQTPEDDSTRPVFCLMQALTSMYLKTENRADVWVAQRAQAGLGSAIPAVFRGEQNAVLAEFIDHVQHPALRARIADIVWTNDRKQGAVAAKAVDAYRACVTGLLEGAYNVEPDMPPRVVGDALFHLKRMLQILNITVKKAKRMESVRQISAKGPSSPRGERATEPAPAQPRLGPLFWRDRPSLFW